MLSSKIKNRTARKGAAMVEYALLVGGIALICAGAVSVFGHKTSDIIGLMAAIVPGGHTEDNAAMISGQLIETAPQGNNGGAGGTAIGLDFTGVLNQSGKDRLGE